MNKFMNISNHPSNKWSEKQLNAAKALASDGIIDLRVPNINPNYDSIDAIVDDIVGSVPDSVSTVLIAGPADFTFKVISALKAKGVLVVTACSERNTIDLPDGSKKVSFDFVQFRSI